VLSLHDVAACSWRTYKHFLTEVQALGVDRVSLLVVPRWHDEDDCTLKDEAFLDWLRALAAEGHDICLHGYNHLSAPYGHRLRDWFIHRFYTDGEAEFHGIALAEALRRLRKGRQVLRDAGLEPCGFTPPAWLISPEGRKAARANGFFYNTTLMHIELLQARQRIYAPTIVFSSRSGWRRVLSRYWSNLWFRLNRKNPILRVAVHPVDLAYPKTRQDILTLIAKAMQQRAAFSYRDVLLKSSRERISFA
jgi:hypothetical protein